MATLLLIDENAVSGAGLLASLVAAGHRAVLAEAPLVAEQLLNQARLLKPHLIILNPAASSFDGMSLLSDLKGHDETKHIDLVAVSPAAGPASSERLQRLGALCHYSRERLGDEELVQRISQIISNRIKYETQI